jgi:hypothetical protein
MLEVETAKHTKYTKRFFNRSKHLTAKTAKNAKGVAQRARRKERRPET